MLRRCLAAGVLGALAGCVVGPGYSGYYDEGYAVAPGYGYGYGAAPAYAYAPAYGYGEVDIAVNGRRSGHDHRDGPPGADWHGARDDRPGHPGPARGYGGPVPQPGQPRASANDGRDANWRGAQFASGGNAPQGHQGGGGRQDGGGSNGRQDWQRNGYSYGR
ncbi:hypothetical protein ACLKMY_18880 [Paraburkholderia mimosarum]|uniref:hypothetical protein n=1 Tax=Paraburkholderia mimosarum TaxID=312026 RepID=UPI0039C0176F